MTESPESESYVRLHVTPLDAELVKVVLSSALLPKARNLSYHTLDNFPEKRYGFVDLPKDDAEKLRKKLNNAVLRGVRISIEPASRPSSIPQPLGPDAMADDKPPKKDKATKRANKDKKRKRDGDEIVGAVLEDGRKVKRGWTNPDEPKEKRRKSKEDKAEKKAKKDKKEKKQQERSKYTDLPECLIKAVLPATAVASVDVDANPDESKRKKKKSKSREVVIHEFEKTVKFPTFLKSTVSTGLPKAPLEFVDGKGWVDEDGNVVEVVKTRPVPAAKKSSKKSKDKHPEPVAVEEAEEDQEEEEEQEKVMENREERKPDSDVDMSDNEDEVEGEGEGEGSVKADVKPEAARPISSSGSVKSLTIKIPPATPQETKVSVHPLEALYKRPKPADGVPTQETSDPQTFNFLANADEDDLIEEEEADAAAASSQVPMTPYSREDFEVRGLRSAAPTPDTAHPNRARFKPWAREDEDIQEDEDEDEDQDEDDMIHPDRRFGAVTAEGSPKPEGANPQSDFQAWFWENRGELNRSWKKRRKMVGKEKRYRENRARMARAI
ncbi:hypothetical protein B0T22DRAFT_275260 [Podospora appendiculata]|uniref:Uncharacterized protein n=1 Tax=Podospora appendiculata TaxID=314037 RepID=A0AAE0X0F0_9PEZI|nr:hypothetical protein B0T22DRAFT_275260 [Podospora appendiculata]